MDLDLTPEHELVRDTVRSFARERVAPAAEELDRESRFPVELVREMAELGLMGIPIKAAYAIVKAVKHDWFGVNLDGGNFLNFQTEGFEKVLRLCDGHVHLPIGGDDFLAHDVLRGL
jgi:hypothetical protein